MKGTLYGACPPKLSKRGAELAGAVSLARTVHFDVASCD